MLLVGVEGLRLKFFGFVVLASVFDMGLGCWDSAEGFHKVSKRDFKEFRVERCRGASLEGVPV